MTARHRAENSDTPFPGARPGWQDSDLLPDDIRTLRRSESMPIIAYSALGDITLTHAEYAAIALREAKRRRRITVTLYLCAVAMLGAVVLAIIAVELAG